MLLKRAGNSAFGEGETWDCEEEMGVERPTMDEAGCKGLEAEAAAASQDANDRTGGVDAVTDASVGIGAGIDPVDKFSLSNFSAYGGTISCCVVFSEDNTAAGRSTEVTARDDDVSEARGTAGALVVVGSDGGGGPVMMFTSSACRETVLRPEVE